MEEKKFAKFSDYVNSLEVLPIDKKKKCVKKKKRNKMKIIDYEKNKQNIFKTGWIKIHFRRIKQRKNPQILLSKSKCNTIYIVGLTTFEYIQK